MNLMVGFKMAFKNIYATKLRSFLTMLGIIIGVASVIALISIAQGSKKEVTEQVQRLGANLITVNITGRGNNTSITYEEAMKWKDKPGVKEVAPVISGTATVKNGRKSEESASIVGVTPSYEDVQNYHVQNGRFVLPIDLTYRQKVALIGTDLSKTLFGFGSPVGQKVMVNGLPFTIIGLLEQKGDSSSGTQDDKLFIPITTAERVLSSKGIKSVSVQADSSDDVNVAVTVIEKSLSVKFNGDTDSYRVLNQQEMLSTVSSVSNTMTLMLGGIAGISLLVGGIGIMNIMLVSVTERTKEIGIRKAIGAKKKDIMLLFLVEAMVLTSLGGLLGIGTGVGSALLVQRFASVEVVLSWNVALIAFGFSVFIGILFGLLPANKASNLKPIDALRFE